MLDSIQQYGEQDDRAKNNLLRVTLNMHQVHSILNDCDNERADQGAKHGPIPTSQRGSAHDDRRDHVQFVHPAVLCISTLEAAGHDQSTQSSQQAGNDISRYDPSIHTNAAQFCSLAISTDRIDGSTIDRVFHDDLCHGVDQKHQGYGDGYAQNESPA